MEHKFSQRNIAKYDESEWPGSARARIVRFTTSSEAKPAKSDGIRWSCGERLASVVPTYLPTTAFDEDERFLPSVFLAANIFRFVFPPISRGMITSQQLFLGASFFSSSLKALNHSHFVAPRAISTETNNAVIFIPGMEATTSGAASQRAVWGKKYFSGY